ncbi:hypothetical protein ACHAO7_003775 [Fusarium culmorum]
MELSETMNFLHNFHLTSGQFSHKNTVKAVRLIPAFFDAPHDGAQLLDIDYRPILECLQGLDENPGPNEQYDFWLYGRASTFWSNIINAHLNSIYYEGDSSESNATTPEDSRYMTPWCALLAAVKFYVEQVVIIWRPLRREIFLHALRILQRDITVAMQKPVPLQLPEMILWESFLGLVSIRGHEKFGDMDQEPRLRPFFEEIVRNQSKVMRLYTWEDMRGVLVSILWPVSPSKDGYMSRIWKTAMSDTDDSKIELL